MPKTILTTAAIAVVVIQLLRNRYAARHGVHNSHAVNARSPSRDRAFLARLLDRVLADRPAGAAPAVLCDIGGAGQITAASDPRGRIGEVIEVNDPATVPGAISEAEFHALARTDFDVVTAFGVGMYLDEDQFGRYFASVRAKLRPEGVLVIADPEYGSGVARSLWSMATSWLLATRIDYKALDAVARIAKRHGFLLVHREAYSEDWYVAMFRLVP